MGAPSSHLKLTDLLQDESLQIFLQGMGEFDRSFCDLMSGGSDFTIRLEVRGNARKLLHCRTYQDNIRRPAEAGSNRKTA